MQATCSRPAEIKSAFERHMSLSFFLHIATDYEQVDGLLRKVDDIATLTVSRLRSLRLLKFEIHFTHDRLRPYANVHIGCIF
jgi:hypothetical protein